YLYIEELDRSSGIRVTGNNMSGIAIGDRVNITGTLATRKISNLPAERQIASSSIIKVNSGAQLQPLFMANLSVGGENAPPALGVTNGTGVRNLGLLARISGKVTS